jgi:hypothetical protein
VPPKWILSLWYIWCKACNYLAATLTLSPNGPKWDSRWPTSPRSSIGCFKNDFEPMEHSMQTLLLSCVKISTISSKRTETSFDLSLVNWEYHCMCLKQFMSLWYVWRQPCTYLALTLTTSPNGPKQDSEWPTSPRISVGYVQNYFWAYGTFGANRAPILRQD